MRRLVITAVALGALAAALVPGMGAGAEATTYAGSATLVAKRSGQQPLLDDGAAVCLTRRATPDQPGGLGGACLGFPQQPGQPAAVLVQDAWLGLDVAFQVCVDMNQDGTCYMAGRSGPSIPPHPQCEDVMAFSHADGVFHNPLAWYRDPVTGSLKPLPTEIPPECRALRPLELRKTFPGYVVFLCEGVHEDAVNGPHTHTPTMGTVQVVTPEPTKEPGTGDFCQTIRDNFKTYYVLP